MCPECLPLHALVLEDFYRQLNADDTIRSHYFNDRFENIYIEAKHVRGLDFILQRLKTEAAALLDEPAEALQLGFWFNLMQRGDVTLPHSHDDDDEQLSGTYYLQVPNGSGELVIQPADDQRINIQPAEGRFVIFHPAVQHEVTTHNIDEARISLGFNIGPKKTATD